MCNSEIIKHKESQVEHYLTIIPDLDKDSALMQINLCVSRICKRKCVFCPQSDKEKNEALLQDKPAFMDYRIILRIAIEAYQKNFKGIFCFNGMGECTENEQLPFMCQVIRMYCPSAQIQIVTNGDNEHIIKEIVRKTPDVLFIFSEYSIEDTERNKRLYKHIPHQEHRKLYDACNVKLLNNRANNVQFGSEEIPEDCCAKPFLKTSVDTNGDLLICNNDWYGVNPYGHIDIEENGSKLWIQWKEKLKDLRMTLLLNERTGCQYPCSLCNDNHQTYGKQFISFWRWSYAKEYIYEKARRFIFGTKRTGIPKQ